MDEHFIPTHGLDLQAYIAAGDVNGAQHLIRYLWARAFLADESGVSSLLDLGCGAGYGSFLLAERFPNMHVLGVDYDPAAVAAAGANFALPNLEFRMGDATRWHETIGPARFEYVLAFDVIEHVDHRELFLENLVEHLLDRGRLLLSTPCAHLTNQLRPAWEFHKIEYSASSLYDFLARYFDHIRRPEDGSVPHLDVFDQLHGTGVDYLLMLNPVVCQQPRRIANPYRAEVVRRRFAPRRISVVAGDWTGDGRDTPALFDNRSGAVVVAGPIGSERPPAVFDSGVRGEQWTLVAGDWDGDGVDSLGLVNGERGIVMLKNASASEGPFETFYLGVAGGDWLAVAGDWRGTGRDTLAVFDRSTKTWHVKDANERASFTHSFVFGPEHENLFPIAGDWDGTGRDGIGVYCPDTASFFLKNDLSGGNADYQWCDEQAGSAPIVGDWDGDGVDRVGVYRVEDDSLLLKSAHAPDAWERRVSLGASQLLASD